MENTKQLYHLVFCDENNKVLCKLSFLFLKDKQFYMLDEVSVVCDSLFKMFFGDRVYEEASWTRDLSVHELAYYASYTKTECDNSLCLGCYVCETCEDEICRVYFFTDDYTSDWYFKENYGFLKGEPVRIG